MDDLLSTLSSSLHVDPTPLSCNPRSSIVRSKVNQEKRRREFLLRQNEKRYDSLQHSRGLATGVFGKDEKGDGSRMEVKEEASDEEAVMPKRPNRSYRNQLMLSEWLVELPESLERDYLIVLCPTGKRGLLVASKGVTKLYARNGYNFLSFVSNLPGGSHTSNRTLNWKNNDFTILDVVYNESLKTVYVLDLMCWKSKPYYDSETSFRLYWLKTQFDECQKELTETQRKIKLERVPFFGYNKEILQNLMVKASPPFEAELDGVLFYHREGHYIQVSYFEPNGKLILEYTKTLPVRVIRNILSI